MTYTESNPYNQIIINANLKGRERGVKDAEVISKFLGQSAVREIKNRIYDLSVEEQAEAHQVLLELMGLPEPDFDNVSDDPFAVEVLGHEGRFVRQIISQNGARFVCYMASSEPFSGAHLN